MSEQSPKRTLKVIEEVEATLLLRTATGKERSPTDEELRLAPSAL